ncbi:MAG TPA: hypothetical protein VNC39_09480 [Acidocella sp.]|uniref:hypothetical protein n=1 Tax=Acidocella sp. TaxID=50710 RepID=UPI002C580974|nr:hypothetical protein [Acidocella sp.]HVE22198.1 hypothetical protein [Acidocella sp.]
MQPAPNIRSPDRQQTDWAGSESGRRGVSNNDTKQEKSYHGKGGPEHVHARPPCRIIAPDGPDGPRFCPHRLGGPHARLGLAERVPNLVNVFFRSGKSLAWNFSITSAAPSPGGSTAPINGRQVKIALD